MDKRLRLGNRKVQRFSEPDRQFRAGDPAYTEFLLAKFCHSVIKAGAEHFQTFLQRLLRDGQRWADFDRLPPSTHGRKEEEPALIAELNHAMSQIMIRLLSSTLYCLQSTHETRHRHMTDHFGVPCLDGFAPC